jgi:3-phenylpropionate/trans-cinnamate dioxygenase ferredoxin subunit
MAFVRAAKLSEVPEGRAIVVTLGETEVALGNVAGQIYAVANLCTHDGGPLGEGELLDHQIECPRHGARFDLRSGAVRTLPAVVPIPTYDVKVEGDDILVDVD